MTFPVGAYCPTVARTVAASEIDVEVVAVPGVAVVVTVSTFAMLTSSLSTASVPLSGTNVATTGMVPAASGVHETSALLPSSPPTFWEPMAFPDAVKFTTPGGEPISVEETVAATV